jgi:GT2 family glycosyltransferase
MTSPAAEICHADVAAPLPAAARAAGDVPLWMYLWRDDVPAALRVFAPSERPLDEETFRAAARDVATENPEPPAVDAASARALSVVVCTRDRPTDLARCLASLRRLDPAPAEIVVVDNAPTTTATRDVVAAAPGVVYVEEPRPGLDVARNTGIAASRGALVAFTDDDVEVHPRWATRLAACFADDAVVAATGLVIPAALDTDAQLLFETALGGLGRGFAPRRFDAAWLRRWRGRAVPVWQIGAGANMAFRRDALARVGGFDERLDVGAAGCSGDSELWYRLLAAGGVCQYTPAAVVHHHHRRDLAALRRQLYFYMRGHVTALLVQFERHRHWGNLARVAVGIPAYYARAVAACVALGLPPDRRLVLRGARGALAGLAYYGRARGIAPSVNAATAAGSAERRP